MDTDNQTIAQSLIELGLLSDEQLEQAEAYAERESTNLVQALLRTNLVTAQDIARAAEHTPNGAASRSGDAGADVIAKIEADKPADGKASLDDYEVDPEALNDVPKSVAEEYLVLPLQVSEDRILVAMADSANVFAMDEIRSRTGKRVEPIEIDEVELRNAIERFYASRARGSPARSSSATSTSNWSRCWTRRRWCVSSSRSSATRCA
jgi:hypothetical protein